MCCLLARGTAHDLGHVGQCGLQGEAQAAPLDSSTLIGAHEPKGSLFLITPLAAGHELPGVGQGVLVMESAAVFLRVDRVLHGSFPCVGCCSLDSLTVYHSGGIMQARNRIFLCPPDIGRGVQLASPLLHPSRTEGTHGEAGEEIRILPCVGCACEVVATTLAVVVGVVVFHDVERFCFHILLYPTGGEMQAENSKNLIYPEAASSGPC